jgi:hypothetical protein
MTAARMAKTVKNFMIVQCLGKVMNGQGTTRGQPENNAKNALVAFYIGAVEVSANRSI